MDHDKSRWIMTRVVAHHYVIALLLYYCNAHDMWDRVTYRVSGCTIVETRNTPIFSKAKQTKSLKRKQFGTQISIIKQKQETDFVAVFSSQFYIFDNDYQFLSLAFDCHARCLCHGLGPLLPFRRSKQHSWPCCYFERRASWFHCCYE